MITLPLFVTAVLAVLLAITAVNVWSFPRLHLEPPPPADNKLPRVSLLIPARNEEAVIASTLENALAQDYPEMEILVLDDRSEDRTADAVAALARQTDRVRLLCGQDLPSGWTGKNWACKQLADAAHGDLLIFTDADVRWHAGALASVVAAQAALDADLLTIWPTQITHTWGERLTVPLMAMVVLAYLPVKLAHDFYHPLTAAANGQCMTFRRAAYDTVGGHAAVRNAIVEDMQLARRIKAAGLHLRMADGAGLLSCRMYRDGRAAIDGYTKNILAGHGNRVSLLALSTLFHWTVFLFPWVWFAAGSSWTLPGWPIWPLGLVAAGITVRTVTAQSTHQRTEDALLTPVSVMLFTWIAARAIHWRMRYGGVLWKGRVIHGA